MKACAYGSQTLRDCALLRVAWLPISKFKQVGRNVVLRAKQVAKQIAEQKMHAISQGLLALDANLLLCTWYANCFALALRPKVNLSPSQKKALKTDLCGYQYRLVLK